jgi:hypothetical protein
MAQKAEMLSGTLPETLERKGRHKILLMRVLQNDALSRSIAGPTNISK